MKPYYEENGITIYHGDCLSLFADLPAAHLMILDPPFDKWSECPVFQKSNTTLAFTNYQNRRDTERVCGQPRSEIIWHFPDGRWISNSLPRITHESILVYGDTGDAFVGPKNEAMPSYKGKAAIGKWVGEGQRYYQPKERKILDSVISIPRNMGGDMGCWGKPVKLLQTLIEWTTKPSDLILDLFMGSGTILRAAKDLGRNAIGVDMDERCCEMAAKRLRQEVLSLEAIA